MSPIPANVSQLAMLFQLCHSYQFGVLLPCPYIYVWSYVYNFLSYRTHISYFFYCFQTLVLWSNACFPCDSFLPPSAQCHRELHFPESLARKGWSMGGSGIRLESWTREESWSISFFPLWSVASPQQWWCLLHAFRIPCTPLSFVPALAGQPTWLQLS